MNREKLIAGFAALGLLVSSCNKPTEKSVVADTDSTQVELIKPLFTTDAVNHDTDDPAIWINPEDPAKSLIVGTDKNVDGALYVFDLRGKTIDSLVVRDIQRPNNVDIGYGL